MIDYCIQSGIALLDGEMSSFLADNNGKLALCSHQRFIFDTEHHVRIKSLKDKI